MFFGSINLSYAPKWKKICLYKLIKDRCLHSKRAHDNQKLVVFSFPKDYRTVSSILYLLTHSSYLRFPSIIMSEFAGPVTENPGISIDRFNGENPKSLVYFHLLCHTDHMVVLNEPELFERSKNFNLKNYCHKNLAALLSTFRLYVHLTPIWYLWIQIMRQNWLFHWKDTRLIS